MDAEPLPLSALLKQARGLRGLAASASEAGVSRRALWLWESGRALPKLSSLLSLASAYKVSEENKALLVRVLTAESEREVVTRNGGTK